MQLKEGIRIVRGFLKEIKKDHVGAYAAQSAYFIMLSFIPFLILLLTLLQYTSITKTDVFTMTQMIFPDTMNGFVINIIDEVYSKNLLVVSVSAVAAAWSAGKGVLALMRGMNTIYEVEERRNYLVLRLRCAIYTVAFVITIVLSLIVLVFGNYIHSLVLTYVPFLAVITGLVVRLKDVVSIAILAFLFMALYWFLPNRKQKFWKQAPGALCATVGWYGFSLGFSFYVSHSAGFSNMYGSLTTIVLIMLWLYFCMYILLLGAEINSHFEKT